MLVIFFGVHYKPGKQALCSTTYTGKIIDEVINQVNAECFKANLFPTDHMPSKKSKEEYISSLAKRKNSLYIALGREVEKWMVKASIAHLIHIPHPGSLRYGGNKEEYISKAVWVINQYLENHDNL